MTDTATTSATVADAPVDATVVEDDAVEEAAANSAVGSTDVVKAIQGLNNPDSAFYSSIKGDDFDTNLKVAAAITNSTPIDDILGQTINLKNFIVMPVDLQNANTGEVTTAPRVILIDDADNAYHATSIGLLTALRNLVAALKMEPSEWPKPVPAKVVEQKGNNGFKFFTLKFV